MNLASSILWIILGAAIIGFGIYYRENFEKVFGAFAIIQGLISLRPKRTPDRIKRYEKSRLIAIAAMLVVYSLVNPLGNIALIFDIFKRDWVLRGGLGGKD